MLGKYCPIPLFASVFIVSKGKIENLAVVCSRRSLENDLNPVLFMKAREEVDYHKDATYLVKRMRVILQTLYF